MRYILRYINNETSFSTIQANLLTNAPFDNFNTSLFFWFGYDVQITLKLRQINYLSHPMRKLKYVILPNNNNDGCNREGVDTSERRLGVFQYLKMDGFNRKYIIDWKCTSRVCKVEIFLKWRGGGGLKLIVNSDFELLFISILSK